MLDLSNISDSVDEYSGHTIEVVDAFWTNPPSTYIDCECDHMWMSVTEETTLDQIIHEWDRHIIRFILDELSNCKRKR